jgi:hypothetical protein
LLLHRSCVRCSSGGRSGVSMGMSPLGSVERLAVGDTLCMMRVCAVLDAALIFVSCMHSCSRVQQCNACA